jgi:hypothetical protein
LLQRTHNPNQQPDINGAVHNNPSPARNHDLDPTVTGALAPNSSLRYDHSRNKSTEIAEPALAIGLAPRKKQLVRNPVPPCCRRRLPRSRQAFLDNPQLLAIRPAPTATGLHNFKAAHMTTISKDIHTDSQLQAAKLRKAADIGWILWRGEDMERIGKMDKNDKNIVIPRPTIDRAAQH